MDWKAKACWDTQCLWASIPKKGICHSGTDCSFFAIPRWHSHVSSVTCSITPETPGLSHPTAWRLLYYHKSLSCEWNKWAALAQKAAFSPGLKKPYTQHCGCWSFCLFLQRRWLWLPKCRKLDPSTAETSLNFVLLPPPGILRHKILNLKLSLRSGRNI